MQPDGYRHILCPVDFSHASKRAMAYAALMAKEHEADLTLLHAVSPLTASEYANVTDMMKAFVDGATQRLHQFKTEIEQTGLPVNAVVVEGFPDLQIAEWIATHEVDLVVLNTRGHRGFKRLLLGSTTERLLRHLPIPLLIINDQTEQTAVPTALRSILLTTDFSHGTPEAVEHACAIAEEHDGRLTLLHVLPPAAPASATNPESPNDHASLERESLTLLEHLIPKPLRQAGRVTTVIQRGEPTERILAWIGDARPDLLVMNIHGKNFVERAFLGSTAERIIRSAPCPILAVPPVLQPSEKTLAARSPSIPR